MPDSFKNRLIQAMANNGIKAVDLAKKTGLSKPQISQYVNGVYEPKPNTLNILAKALNVSDGWLIGRDEPIDRITHEDINRWDKELNPEGRLAQECELLGIIEKVYGKEAVRLFSLFADLNDLGKEKALSSLEDLTAITKYLKGEDNE